MLFASFRWKNYRYPGNILKIKNKNEVLEREIKNYVEFNIILMNYFKIKL